MSPRLRAIMEPHLGHDFTGVRIHTNQSAQNLAEGMGANAVTVGKDIAFGPARFQADTTRGQSLIAHELTHVVQQSTTNAPSVQLQPKKPGKKKPPKKGPGAKYRRIHMTFDGSHLKVFGDGKEVLSFNGSSGRPIRVSKEHVQACGGDARVDTYMSPRFVGMKNLGPIPEGRYVFSPSRMTRFSAGEQFDLLWAGIFGPDNLKVGGRSVHTGDWGAGRVHLRPQRIDPAPCGNPKGRSGFFLHGGVLAGSSGCIDIGFGFDDLADFLVGYKGNVSIEVKYVDQTPWIGFWTGLGGALAYKGFFFDHGPSAHLGFESGGQSTSFVLGAEYRALLGWAGGSLSAGFHVDVPMNAEEASVRAGLRAGANFRLFHALYGTLQTGGFLETDTTGVGFQAGAGLRYDLGPAELSALYNYLDSVPHGSRHQFLLGLGLNL